MPSSLYFLFRFIKKGRGQFLLSCLLPSASLLYERLRQRLRSVTTCLLPPSKHRSLHVLNSPLKLEQSLDIKPYPSKWFLLFSSSKNYLYFWTDLIFFSIKFVDIILLFLFYCKYLFIFLQSATKVIYMS